MKSLPNRLVILALVAAVVGIYSQRHHDPGVRARPPASNDANPQEDRDTAARAPAAGDAFDSKPGTSDPERSPFHCDGRTYCSQMSSCAEARYFLEHCPDVRMDGDHDGIPCEHQWCPTG